MLERIQPSRQVPAILRGRIHSGEVRLARSVDPLRRLIQRRDEEFEVVLRRLRQIEALRRASTTLPRFAWGE